MIYPYACINNKIKPISQGLRLDDLGLLRGYAVFTILRTYSGQPFLLKEHLQRLKQSARQINLTVPFSEKKIREKIAQLLIKNKAKEASIRLIVTGGQTKNGLAPVGSPNFFILIGKINRSPRSFYQKGVKAITVDYCREIPQAKTTNYLALFRFQNLQRQKKAAEIIYVHRYKILEGATSNFFLVKNNSLITPQKNILLGTTRNLVIKLAQPKFKIEERDIDLKELKSAEETFLTSTIKGILPVIKIDNQIIGQGKVGPKTKHLMNLFEQKIKDYF